ncbi:MAG: hypothetical protein PUF27_03925, partial [Bacteroidales bacterium]|nr:hypothetical protein [Bacteroidales bacterium]
TGFLMIENEKFRSFPRSNVLSRCFHFWFFEILVSSLFFWLYPLFGNTDIQHLQFKSRFPRRRL